MDPTTKPTTASIPTTQTEDAKLTPLAVPWGMVKHTQVGDCFIAPPTMPKLKNKNSERAYENMLRRRRELNIAVAELPGGSGMKFATEEAAQEWVLDHRMKLKNPRHVTFEEGRQMWLDLGKTK